MKTILITGGTDGIGLGVATHFLKAGDRVIVVGSTASKGDAFLQMAQEMGAGDRALFLQANLSLVSENERLIEEVKQRVSRLDVLVLSAQAQKMTTEYRQTREGFELVFALYYLSRFLLSFGLKPLLEQSDRPVILSVAGPGGKGLIQWDDLQISQGYRSLKAILHGSRLNDLLGVAFAQHDPGHKTKYILYNPGAVQTRGVLEAFDQPLIRLIVRTLYAVIAAPVSKAIVPLIDHLEHPPLMMLSAFQDSKNISTATSSFDPADAQRLFDLTQALLSTHHHSFG